MENENKSCSELHDEHVCVYCGRPASYKFNNGKWCCSKSHSSCPAIIDKSKQSTQNLIDKLKKLGYNRLTNPNKLSNRKHYDDESEHVCSFCGGYAEYRLKNGKWCCSEFVAKCPSIREQNSKRHEEMHKNGAYDDWNYRMKTNSNCHVWNKGLTAETDERIRGYKDKLISRYASGELHVWSEGKNLTDEQKRKISDSMIVAHEEHRAHNIGDDRHRGIPSFAELYFITFIEKYCINKNFCREFRVGRFSLDLSFVENKKCIEIDGDQHYRTSSNILRDKRKAERLSDDGWCLMRISWKQFRRNHEKYLKFIKLFVDGVIDDDLESKLGIIAYELYKETKTRINKLEKEVKDKQQIV